MESKNFAKDVELENRVFTGEGVKQVSTPELARRLNTETWRVIKDKPVTLECGSFLVSITPKNEDINYNAYLPRLREQLDLVEYLLAVQPKRYLDREKGSLE